MMKRLCLILGLLSPLNTCIAQSVTVGTISKTTLCVGDTVWVPYTSSGSFAADNFFAVQLSDANGDFSTFTNIGHSPTVSDSIPVAISFAGDHFRVRVIATDPFTLSSDTSAEILVLNYPSPKPTLNTYATSFGYAAFAGDAIQFSDGTSEPLGSNYVWRFGQDANIFVSISPSPKVSYSTAGIKSGSLTVSNSAGCQASVAFQFIILSCSPLIPDTAHVVTGVESGSYAYVWVKSGGNYTANEPTLGSGVTNTIVFAEPGASVYATTGSLGFYYLKSGASLRWDSPSHVLVILNNGNFISFKDYLHSIDTLYCNNLQFDYSQVRGSDVHIEEKPLGILNTANGLRVSCEGENISASVINIFGITLFSKTDRDLLYLDLSVLTDGVYFAIITSGNHREFRKIAVLH